jgi:Zn finger protein HypA/HybF involved in hydrogenase expression
MWLTDEAKIQITKEIASVTGVHIDAGDMSDMELLDLHFDVCGRETPASGEDE